MSEHSTQTTILLHRMRAGDHDAAEALFPLIYDELHAIARRSFRNQPAAHTLQPTALVHEAYLRLCTPGEAAVNDRAHFLAVAATAMRQILIDHARRRGADKRGGDRRRVLIHDDLAAQDDDQVDLLALDEACRKLATMDERKSRVIELRFFAGLGLEETAEVLGVARSTVAEDWRVARAWLVNELRGDEAS